MNFSIWDKKIQSVKIHGDFAPWNLKFSSKRNKMIAYDWEMSQESSLPFYDLIFYKFSVQKLLHKKVDINCQEYLSALEKKGFLLEKKFLSELYEVSRILVLIQLSKTS